MPGANVGTETRVGAGVGREVGINVGIETGVGVGSQRENQAEQEKRQPRAKRMENSPPSFLTASIDRDPPPGRVEKALSKRWRDPSSMINP